MKHFFAYVLRILKVVVPCKLQQYCTVLHGVKRFDRPDGVTVKEVAEW